MPGPFGDYGQVDLSQVYAQLNENSGGAGEGAGSPPAQAPVQPASIAGDPTYVPPPPEWANPGSYTDVPVGGLPGQPTTGTAVAGRDITRSDGRQFWQDQYGIIPNDNFLTQAQNVYGAGVRTLVTDPETGYQEYQSPVFQDDPSALSGISQNEVNALADRFFGGNRAVAEQGTQGAGHATAVKNNFSTWQANNPGQPDTANPFYVDTVRMGGFNAAQGSLDAEQYLAANPPTAEQSTFLPPGYGNTGVAEGLTPPPVQPAQFAAAPGGYTPTTQGTIDPARITSPGVTDQADINALSGYISNLSAVPNPTPQQQAQLADYQQRQQVYETRVNPPTQGNVPVAQPTPLVQPGASAAAYQPTTQAKIQPANVTTPGVTDQADIAALQRYQSSLNAKKAKSGLSADEQAKLDDYAAREKAYSARITPAG